jgi:sarcosine oxidase subunit gamma
MTTGTRRSPVQRLTDAAAATYAAIGDGGVALRYAGGADEVAAARSLALADVSVLPRVGFKGADAPEWLVANGCEIPARPNRAQRQPNGTLVARLSEQEHLILSSLAGEGIESLASRWSMDLGIRCYLLPRDYSHFWFVLCGRDASATLAKVCGVDMRVDKFADGNIAQTSIARISAVIVRSDLGGTPAFHLLADIASAEYLLVAMLDAMAELRGGLVGVEALRALAAAP